MTCSLVYIFETNVLEEGKKQKRENSKIKKKIKRWWKNALVIFDWFPQDNKYNSTTSEYNSCNDFDRQVHHVHNRTGSVTRYRTTSLPSFGPLAGTSTKDEVEIPYISLRELNMDQQKEISTTAMPIYLVT